MRVRSFMREKKIYCGDNYMEVDIFQYTDTQRCSGKKKRATKKIESAPKQHNLNDKNAKRYFGWLVNGNFGKGDLHVTLTYKDKFLPKTVEDAEREAKNYIRRVKNRREKEGLPPVKYILVTECVKTKDDDHQIVRVHHHIILNGGLSRDVVEGLWSRRKKKGQVVGEKIGYANADRLQPTEEALNALCNYLTKYPKRKKRWSSSQNLVRPWSRPNDTKYKKRQVEKLARNMDSEEIEKKYPGWRLAGKSNGMKVLFNEYTGWSMYLKFYREELIE